MYLRYFTQYLHAAIFIFVYLSKDSVGNHLVFFVFYQITTRQAQLFLNWNSVWIFTKYKTSKSSLSGWDGKVFLVSFLQFPHFWSNLPTSGAPHGTILGPLTFRSFLKNYCHKSIFFVPFKPSWNLMRWTLKLSPGGSQTLYNLSVPRRSCSEVQIWLTGPFTRPCSLRITGAWMLQSRASQNPGTPAIPTMPVWPTAPGKPRGPRGPSMPFLGSAGLPGKPATEEIVKCINLITEMWSIISNIKQVSHELKCSV